MSNKSQQIAELRRQIMIQQMMPTIITSIVLGVLAYLASAIGLLKMFEKAGEKSWKAWIPFYNTYILFKLCWKKYYFWVIPIGTVLVSIIGNIRAGSAWATVILVIICLVVSAMFVLKCFLAYHIARCYSKNWPWVVGLIFVPCVMYILLGWGAAMYDPKHKALVNANNVSKKPKSPKTSVAKQKPKGTPKPEQPDYIDPKPKAKF